MRVEINGIRYIPAKETTANLDDVAKTLLLDYWGTVSSKEKLDALINDPEIKIIVTDSTERGRSLSDFLDDLAEISCAKK